MMDRFNCNSQAAAGVRSWHGGAFPCSLPIITHCARSGAQEMLLGFLGGPSSLLLSFFSRRHKPPWSPCRGLVSLSPSHRPAESFLLPGLGAQHQGDRLCRLHLRRVMPFPFPGLNVVRGLPCPQSSASAPRLMHLEPGWQAHVQRALRRGVPARCLLLGSGLPTQRKWLSHSLSLQRSRRSGKPGPVPSKPSRGGARAGAGGGGGAAPPPPRPPWPESGLQPGAP